MSVAGKPDCGLAITDIDKQYFSNCFAGGGDVTLAA